MLYVKHQSVAIFGASPRQQLAGTAVKLNFLLQQYDKVWQRCYAVFVCRCDMLTAVTKPTLVKMLQPMRYLLYVNYTEQLKQWHDYYVVTRIDLSFL